MHLYLNYVRERWTVEGENPAAEHRELLVECSCKGSFCPSRTARRSAETAAERDVPIHLACDYFQGYLCARPARPFPAVAWSSEDHPALPRGSCGTCCSRQPFGLIGAHRVQHRVRESLRK